MTVTPDKYLNTPITRPDGSILCRKCSRQLGVDEDGVSIRFGNVRLFGRYVKYFCVCGKVYNFSERDIGGGHGRSGLPDATHEILNELGKEYNDNYLRDKNKKHDDDHGRRSEDLR